MYEGCAVVPIAEPPRTMNSRRLRRCRGRAPAHGDTRRRRASLHEGSRSAWCHRVRARRSREDGCSPRAVVCAGVIRLEAERVALPAAQSCDRVRGRVGRSGEGTVAEDPVAGDTAGVRRCLPRERDARLGPRLRHDARGSRGRLGVLAGIRRRHDRGPRPTGFRRRRQRRRRACRRLRTQVPQRQ